MKRSPISILLLVMCAGVFSQNRWQEGCLFLKNNDTICGWIDIVKSTQKPEYCFFKSQKKRHEQVYSVNALIGYQLNNGRLFTKREISRNGESKIQFVEFLVDGIVNLYTYRSNGLENFLLDIEGQTPLQLENTKIIVEDNENSYQIDYKKFTGVVKAAMKDCPEIYDDIDNLTLSQHSLKDISVKYHDIMCTTGEECIVYMKTENNEPSMFGAFAGFSIGYVNMEETENSEMLRMKSLLGGYIGGLFYFPVIENRFNTHLNAGICSGRRYLEGEIQREDEPLYRYSYTFHNTYLGSFLGVSVRQSRPGLKFGAGFYGVININLQNKFVNYRTLINEPFDEADIFNNDIGYSQILPGYKIELSTYIPVFKQDHLGIGISFEQLFANKDLTDLLGTGNKSYKIRDHSIKFSFTYYF